MGTVTDQYNHMMAMSVDNTNRLITTKSLNIDGWKTLEHTIKPTYINPIGSLLFSFINADFYSYKGFKGYVSSWGISGFMEINEDEKIDYTAPEDSVQSEILLFKIFSACKNCLILAKTDFQKVVDFCVNVDNIECLEGLSTTKRFFVGRHLGLIPDIEKYNKPMFTIYNVNRKHYNQENKLNVMENQPDYDLQMLCNSIKDDTMKTTIEYRTKNILTFVYYEFCNILDNFDIKKCKNCGDYFVPQYRSNEVYCVYCKDIGYVNKVKNDELLRLYNTAYKTKHAQKQRSTRGQGEAAKEMYNNTLETWRETARQRLVDAQSGVITVDEFKEFLNKKLKV